MAEIDASLIDVTACGICCVRFGKHQDGEKRQLLRFVICFLSVIECSKSPCQPWDELQALRSHHSIIHSSQEKHFSSYSSWPRVLVAMSCLCGRLMGGWGGGGCWWKGLLTGRIHHHVFWHPLSKVCTAAVLHPLWVQQVANWYGVVEVQHYWNPWPEHVLIY